MDEFITHLAEQGGIGRHLLDRLCGIILTPISELRTLGIISLEVKVGPSDTLATYTFNDGKRGTIRLRRYSSQSSSQPGVVCAHPENEPAKPGDS